MHPFLLKEDDSWIKSTMLKLYFQIIKYVGVFLVEVLIVHVSMRSILSAKKALKRLLKRSQKKEKLHFKSRTYHVV